MWGKDTNQIRVIKLLREVHLIAFKEIERLNLPIIELENQNRQPIDQEIINPTVPKSPPAIPPLFPEATVDVERCAGRRILEHECR
jgi:hypothetical protein